MLVTWSDAGYVGMNVRAQTGVFVSWAGAPITWRSTRQAVSTLSMAEAELTAGAVAWQITEGLRALLEDWGIAFYPAALLLDNDAALAICDHGSNWRTRYFGVRASRIQ